ncbi:TetR/AcrR family transcriptional regulator [Marinoscillum sp. MHG1-6]|uniref:TetR/AcrR family transcriptional regulator n=1 Tax=Marinoscillum sp. MHG1-6 TaxID=2959627 RepID=UPI002157AA09|nr:TetR/AcrR family transcriptional regulator [Marinoscillum sp. MHG1-6]
MEAKEKIVEGAKRLFFQYGVRSVSMDDVARELTMSKKTLYQYFTNKDELVNEVLEGAIEEEKHRFYSIPDAAENAVHELFLLSSCIKETVNAMHPSLMYDLKKYHAEAWGVFQKFKYEFIRGTVVKNIKRGKHEGYYREHMNAEVISTLRVETIQLVFDGVFAKLDIPYGEIQMQLFEHFAFGLMTDKGNKLFENYLKDGVENVSVS